MICHSLIPHICVPKRNEMRLWFLSYLITKIKKLKSKMSNIRQRRDKSKFKKKKDYFYILICNFDIRILIFDFLSIFPFHL